MTVLIFFLISYILLSFSLYKLFPKANIDATKGLIPGVNFVEWAQAIGRSRWYPLWLLLPIVNIFIFTGMAVDLVRSFGQYKFRDTALAVIYAPLSFFKIAKENSIKYLGPTIPAEAAYAAKIEEAREAGKKREYEKLINKSPYKKAVWREWVESIFFAVFAAAFIRMFLIEAYVIPTPSMEGSLKVGDFLFVSKPHYGLRTPSTIAMIPLLHNRIPIIGGESYLEKPSIPSYRLPAIQDVQRNKPFVFNWPVGDSIYLTPVRSYSVGQVKRAGNGIADPELRKQVQEKNIITRPLDKKDHYIKRCVGLPGDTLEVRNRDIYIDGVKQNRPEKIQFNYDMIPSQGATMDIRNTAVRKRLMDKGIGEDSDLYRGQYGYMFVLDPAQLEFMKTLDPKIEFKIVENKPDPVNLFPHDPTNYPSWSIDDYGPIWIPAKGSTLKLTPENISLYKRAIAVYEGNELKQEGSRFFINGEETDSYTFKQDYYWAMGDNRHNSEDSRAWGFVPFDHILGKPLFVWFSTVNGSISNGIRWNRLFMSADVD